MPVVFRSSIHAFLSQLWPVLVIGAIAVLGVAACENQADQPLEPEAAMNDDTCIYCGSDEEGWYINPWVDSVGNEAGEVHNEDLAYAVVGLQDSVAVYGELTRSKAESIIRPRVEEHLASEGISVPSSAWIEVPQAVQEYRNGEDIVGTYAYSGMTTAAKHLARELLDAVDLLPDRQAFEAKLDSLKVEADQRLYGDELEAFSGVIGVASHSTQYWNSSTNQDSWDHSVAGDPWEDFVMCGVKMAAGDIAGGVFGWLRMPPGGWFSAAYGAAVGSTMAAAMGC